MKSASPTRKRRGFTLIELLVVIGIILLLLAILLPVVSQVRTRAYQATTQSQMSRIMAACQSYFHDFNSYPGPVANVYLKGASGGADPKAPLAVAGQITSSENLVLGLLGMLTPATTLGGRPTFVPLPTAPHDVLSLNPLHPQSYHYIDYVADELDSGKSNSLDFMTKVNPTDSSVPEFVDRFPDHAPILYVRANVGNPGVASADDKTQYDYQALSPYGCSVLLSDGTSKQFPFDQTYFTSMSAFVIGTPTLADAVATPFSDWNGANGKNDGFFQNPNISGSARGKDGFVLISAGVDRTYGTHDDIIVTP